MESLASAIHIHFEDSKINLQISAPSTAGTAARKKSFSMERTIPIETGKETMIEIDKVGGGPFLLDIFNFNEFANIYNQKTNIAYCDLSSCHSFITQSLNCIKSSHL